MFIKILLKYILGYVRITVEGYYIERFINICTTSKILIWNLKRNKRLFWSSKNCEKIKMQSQDNSKKRNTIFST